MLDAGGEAIEQVKFADISLDKDIEASALAPTNNTEDFRWYTSQPRRKIDPVSGSDWRHDGVPKGFRVMSTHQEKLPESDKTVTHILFSDGLANVSVFVEPNSGKQIAERSRVGASNSFSIATNGYLVTAVGEVPAETVERIARSMQPNNPDR